MLTKRGLVILACLSFVIFSGCSRTPKGFPKVFPCRITVVDGTTPIADVEVSLLATTPSDGMVFFGKTDVSGVCKVGTTHVNCHKKGVPEGSYKVVLVKEPFVEDTKTREEQNAMSRDELDAYRKQMQDKRNVLPRIIPDLMTSNEKTPLTLDVNGKGVEMTVNVAEHQ